MHNWTDGGVFFAQLGAAGDTTQNAAPGTPGTGGGGGANAPTGGLQFPLLIFGFMILMFVMMGMSGRKQRKKRQEMLSSVGKGDKVQTSGGIIGTIVEMGDKDLVLRVDEQSATRIRFARSAVTTVLRSRASGGVEKPPMEVVTAGGRPAAGTRA